MLPLAGAFQAGSSHQVQTYQAGAGQTWTDFTDVASQGRILPPKQLPGKILHTLGSVAFPQNINSLQGESRLSCGRQKKTRLPHLFPPPPSLTTGTQRDRRLMHRTASGWIVFLALSA